MPLYLSEEDVGSLLTVEEALPVVEESFRAIASGQLRYLPRRKVTADGGYLAVMSAVDDTRQVAGLKSYTYVDGRLSFVVCLFELSGGLAAIVEAETLSQIRTGAASGVAARYLARDGATRLGLIGTGLQARSQLAAIRAAVPTVREVVAWSPNERRRRAFCKETGAGEAESAQQVAACDIVVTATTARDPVLRGDWLHEGALVIGIGANEPPARELDNVVLQRASFVCCDSLEQSRYEAADLIEPVASGTIDWLEVHELHEVVMGLPGRQADTDIVVFKSNGIAAWDVVVAAELLDRARARGVGREV